MWICRSTASYLICIENETKRRQLAEAAEKRQKESTHRGIKNPEAVERKKKKQEEIEKQAMSTSPSGGSGLRWQVG
ncbi:small VCP/p97-interacting protein isoform X2 [Ictalurus furcatus]|uniref:small VCP/p97-interacting protein isoform X2 n=1 Tax=Ictalurus furcatus TaxID=66913 RepID=UPI0023507E79|nr:small VCP/p97-interacting protein isoform X2 [Ictalurus furcatus]